MFWSSNWRFVLTCFSACCFSSFTSSSFLRCVMFISLFNLWSIQKWALTQRVMICIANGECSYEVVIECVFLSMAFDYHFRLSLERNWQIHTSSTAYKIDYKRLRSHSNDLASVRLGLCALEQKRNQIAICDWMKVFICAKWALAVA